MSSFRDDIRRIAPTWLSKGVGEAVLYMLALPLDGFADWLMLAVLARHPDTAPSDGLAYIGRDRSIQRGFVESDASYRARLKLWLPSWKKAGSAGAVLEQIAGYLSPTPTMLRLYCHNGDCYTWTAGGTADDMTWVQNTGFDWDSLSNPERAQLWARCWLIIYPADGSPWAADRNYGDGGRWGDGRTWGTTATIEQVRTVRVILAQWKSAVTLFVSVIIAFDPASFAPDGSGPPLPSGWYGDPKRIINGQAVPSRLTTARYWDGQA